MSELNPETKDRIKALIHEDLTLWRQPQTINSDLDEIHTEWIRDEQLLEILKEMKEEGMVDFWPQNKPEPTIYDGEWRSIPREGKPELSLTGEKTGSILLDDDKTEEEQIRLDLWLQGVIMRLTRNPSKVQYRSRALGWEDATVTKVDGDYIEGTGDNSGEKFRLWLGNYSIRKYVTPEEKAACLRAIRPVFVSCQPLDSHISQ